MPRPRKAPTAGWGNMGKSWESRLDSMHEMYMRQGRAYVQETGPKVLITGRRDKLKRLIAIVIGSAPPDRLVVCRGVPFVFDAKEKEGHRFPLKSIEDHQAAHLEAAMRAGAKSGIMLHLKDTGLVAMLPWEALGPMFYQWRKLKMTRKSTRGVASLDTTQIREMAVYLGKDCDYLRAVFGPGA